jgi:hypothetical protein
MSEWVAWHEGYEPDSPLSRRLEVVQKLIRVSLDSSPRGLIRVVSLCAGDGRDILGVLESHPRAIDVQARLVELDPELAARARERAARLSRTIEVVNADASETDVYADFVPADLVLACGIFGNISDDDVHNTVARTPELCAPGATVIWTRGTFTPNLTPTIRRWFSDAGFSELSFVRIPGSTAAVGADQLTGPPRAFVPGGRLFTFLARDARPSRRGIIL